MNLTEEEARWLVDLISWAVQGPEQGVITRDQWKEKCRQLAKLLHNKGYRPHGQWVLL